MIKIKPRTLSGFMELLPSYQVYFDEMIRRLEDSFSLYGYTPLDTPLMEAAEILLAKGGGETEKQMYTLRKGDTDLAMRYELTASLAKFTAMNYGSLSFPFRRYEIGKVYRGERAQRGRYREFYQADIDIIGDGTLDFLNEAEIPSIIYRSLSSLGLKKFRIHINNRKMLNGFFEIIGIKRAATDVMRIIDKFEKIGTEKMGELLMGEIGISEAQAEQLRNLVTHKGDPFEFLDKYRGKNETFDQGFEELATVAKNMAGFGVPETHFKIDISIARGLDYYTGTVYETFITDYPQVGSICSGGRYDNLAEYYTDKKLPGVGISIGLTRLFSILQEHDLLNPDVLTSPTDILIIPMTDNISHSVSLATSMREAGLRTQIYCEDKKFKHKINYANKQNIPFTVFLGEDEISKNMITVKNMLSGEQTTASAKLLTVGIRDKILAMRDAPPIREK